MDVIEKKIVNLQRLWDSMRSISYDATKID